MRSTLRRKLQVLRDSKPVSRHATWAATVYLLQSCEAFVYDLPKSGTSMLRVMTQKTFKDNLQIR